MDGQPAAVSDSVGALLIPVSPLVPQLLQAATVLPLRDCYVSFTDPTGRSSDKKQFVIADERGDCNVCVHVCVCVSQ